MLSRILLRRRRRAVQTDNDDDREHIRISVHIARKTHARARAERLFLPDQRY